MLFNRQSNGTHVLLDVPAHSYPTKQTTSLSLVVATSLFEHSSLSANLYKGSLSAFLHRLSPFSLTFPDACGDVSPDPQ